MKQKASSDEPTGAPRAAHDQEGQGLTVSGLGIWQRMNEFEDLNKMVVDALEKILIEHGLDYDSSRGFFIDPIYGRHGVFEVHVAINGRHDVVRVEAPPEELKLHARLVEMLHANWALALLGKPDLRTCAQSSHRASAKKGGSKQMRSNTSTTPAAVCRPNISRGDMTDSQQSTKTWQQVLQEYISDDCDYDSDEAGPLAAFKLAVPEVVAREHELRYEGEDMGAYRTLERAIEDLRSGGLEAIAGLEVRLESLKRDMVSDGYDFETEPNKIYPPSTVLADDPAVARRIQHAYDVAMAFQTGGDPGSARLAAAFTDAFGDEDTVFSLELKDRL